MPESLAYENQPTRLSPHRTPSGQDLVSIIIPCYRQEAYLGEAVRSALDQTYPHLEIIVVDDGSPGDVAGVVAPFPGVKLIRLFNSGAAVARNRGMAEAAGSYLLFLDADDRLLPDAVARQLAVLRSRPELAFVSGQVQVIDGAGRLIEIPPFQEVQADHFRVLLGSNYIWTPGVVLYRRSVFENGQAFDTSAGGSADYELNIRLARQHPVAAINEVVLEYRVHEENMSANAALMLRSGIKVRRALYPFVRHDPALRKAWKQGIKAVQHDKGEALLKELAQNLRTGKARPTLGRDAWYLMKYYPLGLPRKLIRWLLGRN